MASCISKTCSSRVSWKWNHIFDVVHSSCEKDHPFKPQTKAAVLHSSIATKIKVPLVRLQRKSQLQHPAYRVQFTFLYFQIKTSMNKTSVSLYLCLITSYISSLWLPPISSPTCIEPQYVG